MLKNKNIRLNDDALRELVADFMMMSKGETEQEFNKFYQLHAEKADRLLEIFEDDLIQKRKKYNYFYNLYVGRNGQI